MALAACGRGDEPVDSLECPPDAVPGATIEPLRRLSVDDYERTLRVLFGDEPVDAIEVLVASLPLDSAQAEGAFPRQDQRLGQAHIDGWFDVADALSRRAVTDGTMRVQAGLSCASGIDPTCLDRFVPTFLERAWGRPPSSSELADKRALVDEFGPEDGLRAVVFTTLMSPDLLYHLETGGEEHDGVLTLDAHAFASRLSYHFWGEPPDETLRSAAASGRLDTPEGLAQEVRRLSADLRFQRTIDRFFASWLHLERGELVPGPRLSVLAAGLDTEGLADAMREEVEVLLRDAARSTHATWYDVLTTRDSFATDERLAAIYGVEPWDGQGVPPQLDPTERSGLLTRAGLLATTDGSTNPFRRGAFVRRLALCQEVPAPPADLPPDALVPPDPGPGATTREVFEAKVDSAECAACHVHFSPLGYALETYDGLGRFRTEEHLVTASGEDLGRAPIDDTVTTAIGTTSESIAGAVELSDRIAESRAAHACLARQYFRFSYRRDETEADACVIERWTDRVAEGEPLREWFRQVALDPRFRLRALEE